MNLTEAQLTSDSLNITAGVALASTTLLAAPGANLRYRIFGVDLVALPTNTGKVRCGLRDIVSAIAIGTTSINAGGGNIGDHLFFGEGGIVLPTNSGLEARHIASVAAQDCTIVVRYIVEDVN